MSQDNLVKFRCTACKRLNHFSTKNKKTVTKALEFSKYCRWCKAHTSHKESRK